MNEVVVGVVLLLLDCRHGDHCGEAVPGGCGLSSRLLCPGLLGLHGVSSPIPQLLNYPVGYPLAVRHGLPAARVGSQALSPQPLDGLVEVSCHVLGLLNVHHSTDKPMLGGPGPVTLLRVGSRLDPNLLGPVHAQVQLRDVTPQVPLVLITPARAALVGPLGLLSRGRLDHAHVEIVGKKQVLRLRERRRRLLWVGVLTCQPHQLLDAVAGLPCCLIHYRMNPM